MCVFLLKCEISKNIRKTAHEMINNNIFDRKFFKSISLRDFIINPILETEQNRNITTLT